VVEAPAHAPKQKKTTGQFHRGLPGFALIVVKIVVNDHFSGREKERKP